MFDIGCVVAVHTGTKEGGTGSGILVDTKHGLVISHGTIVTSLLTDGQIDLLNKEGIIKNCFNSWEVEVLFEKQPKNEKSKNLTSVLRSSETIESACMKKQTILKHCACVLSIFRLQKLGKSVSFLMPQDKWEFVEDFSKQENPDIDTRFYPLLSCFIVIKINNWTSYVSNLPLLSFSQIVKGDNLEVEATPFGGLSPEIFINSISSGILSNKAGGILLMTDARCVPGTEGGPVFCKKGDQRFLVAMVIASLCWRCNEWVGLSMACSITDILKVVRQIWKQEKNNIDFDILQIDNKVHRSSLSELIISVPMVIVGSNWGSGVVIGHLNESRSLLVTCSHVIRQSEYRAVKIRFTDDHLTKKATVIYKTPLDRQFDLALLSVPQKTVDPIPVLASPVRQGDKVYVIGHAIFGEEKNLEPSITSGVISKVLCVNNIPIMLQTTCAVHAGASGGAIVNKDGQLIGIPVSNAKDTVSKASYPHVNMCVPMATIYPIIQRYMSSGDTSVLEKLILSNKYIRQLWTLDEVKTASKL